MEIDNSMIVDIQNHVSIIESVFTFIIIFIIIIIVI